MSKSPQNHGPASLLPLAAGRRRDARQRARSRAEARPAFDDQLKRLDALYEGWIQAQRPGSVLVIHGPQALTAAELARDWRRTLLRQGETVFEASCGGRHTYGALRDLVSAYFAHLDDLGLIDAHLHQLFEDLSGALGLSGIGRQSRSTPPQALAPSVPGPIIFYERVGRFFVEASALKPAVLIVRDLHQADSATLAAITYLAQNFALDPIDAYIPDGVAREGFRGLLTLTVQETPSDHPDPVLDPLRRDLKDRAHAELIGLRGVDEETVRQYLQRPEVIRRVLRCTGGRPKHLRALLDTLPSSQEDLLHAQLAALSDAALTLLRVLTVYGRALSPDVLVQLAADHDSDSDPDASPDASSATLRRAAPTASGGLAQLIDQGLVVRQVGRGQLRVDFAQPTTARLIYDATPDPTRRLLHRLVARLLAQRHAQGQHVVLEEIAHHYLRSDDTTSAVQYALRAAEALHIAFAYQPARELLERVLPFIEDTDDLSTVYERLIDIAAALNEHQTALTWCQRLMERADDAQRAGVHRRVGQLRLALGAYDEAIASLQEALDAADAFADTPDHERVRALSALAEAHCGQGNYDQAVSTCHEGLALAAAEDAPPTLRRLELDLTNTLGKVCLFREDYAAAEDYFQTGRRRAVEGHWLDAQLRALFNLGTLAVQQRRYEQAEEIFLECLDFGHHTANPITRASCLLNLAVIYQKTHRYAQALDCYLHGLATFKMSGNDLKFAVTAMNLAVLYQLLGDLLKATALIDAAIELTQAHKMRYFYARSCYVRGTIALEDDQPADALESFRTAQDGLQSAGRAMQARLLIHMAMAHHRLNQHEPRDAAMAKIDLDPSTPEGQELEGDVALARATFLGDDGRWAEAEATARTARDRFAQAQLTDRLWHAHYQLARCCRALDRPQEARRYATLAADQIDDQAQRLPAPMRERFLSGNAQQRLQRLQRALEGGTPFVEVEPPPADDETLSDDPDRPTLTVGDPIPDNLRPWRERYQEIVGEDARLHHLFRMVDKVARSDSTVLLIGPSGTGKELFAEAIHRHSKRHSGPLIKVNCAAFVETLLLSELFGHEKGAFTGALSRKKGRFELAHRGTLFLDEIGDISLNTQVALLRVLQERRFERVGGNQPIEVDVRVIAATNRNLEDMVREGTFRLDLYYRLKGVMLELPALRDRRADIPYLVRHFTEQFTQDSRPRWFSHDALRLLAAYNWPGNIRELENFVRSILLFVDNDTVTLDDIRQFDEFFAEGEMSDDAPLIRFAPRWWSDAPTPADRSAHTSDGTGVASSSGVPSDHAQADDTPASADAPEATAEAPTGQTFEDPEAAIVEQVVRDGLSLQDLKKRLEIECIKRALHETGGNITHAARLLQMKRPRLSQIINANDELGRLKDALN